MMRLAITGKEYRVATIMNDRIVCAASLVSFEDAERSLKERGR